MKPETSNLEQLPLSLLNDYLYCPRRAALKVVEGWRAANEHTVRGEIVHEHADLPGYEVAKGVTVLRALPVWSERLGLSGKCDIVEMEGNFPEPTRGIRLLTPALSSVEEEREHLTPSLRPDATARQAALSPERRGGVLRPVEYKKGRRREFENDDAQLCAQGLCLEEMFGVAVLGGAVFHAASKRRREVEFTAELRKLTKDAAMELHQLVNMRTVPPAVFKPACEECSLYKICLPEITSLPQAVEHARKHLFEV